MSDDTLLNQLQQNFELKLDEVKRTVFQSLYRQCDQFCVKSVSYLIMLVELS